MSTQRGNHSRTRAQKHKNRTVFKNNLHDTSHTTKRINGIQVCQVCARCKDIIEWKIKYKKYKPLSQPKTCVKCQEKTVKKAYHVMCSPCGAKFKVCPKCCQPREVVPLIPDDGERLRLDGELKQMLQTLPERKRRTFIRYMNKKDAGEDPDVQKTDLLEKLAILKVKDDDDFELDGSDFSGFEDDDETT